MNSKNQTYKSLSREELENYPNATQLERHRLERKALDDPFEQDALDGWDKANFQLGLMSNLDKKFMKASPSIWSPIVISALCVAIVAIVFYYENTTIDITDNSEQVAQTEQPVVFIEKTDLIDDSEIEDMKDEALNELASTPILVKKFKEEKVQTRENLPRIEIEKLPILELKPEVPQTKSKEIKNRFGAKEIYLHDFKLVDYRSYRSRPVIPTEQLELSGVPADREHAGSSAVESTWKSIDVPYHDYVNKTMEYMNRGNYKKALQRFNVILDTYTDDINAHFYSAICYYNMQEFDQAINHFKVCLYHRFENFDEESLWLIAHSLEAKGMSHDALTIYQEIATNGGFYANQAKEMLKK